MKKVLLPGDNWAMLRDADEVTERQRRPLVRLQRRTMIKLAPSFAGSDIQDMKPAEFLKTIAPALSAEDYDALEEIDDVLIATLVADWSFPYSVSAENSLDLPPAVREALLGECRERTDALLGVTTDEDVLNPESPTVAANDSDKP